MFFYACVSLPARFLCGCVCYSICPAGRMCLSDSVPVSLPTYLNFDLSLSLSHTHSWSGNSIVIYITLLGFALAATFTIPWAVATICASELDHSSSSNLLSESGSNTSQQQAVYQETENNAISPDEQDDEQMFDPVLPVSPPSASGLALGNFNLCQCFPEVVSSFSVRVCILLHRQHSRIPRDHTHRLLLLLVGH